MTAAYQSARGDDTTRDSRHWRIEVLAEGGDPCRGRVPDEDAGPGRGKERFDDVRATRPDFSDPPRCMRLEHAPDRAVVGEH